jgi:hypothetical protein
VPEPANVGTYWKDADAEDPVANNHPSLTTGLNGREVAFRDWMKQAGGKVAYIVAAADSPAEYKAFADYVCTGTSSNRIDHNTVNTAYDALPADGGEIWLAPGEFWFGGTFSVDKQQTIVRWLKGAVFNWTTVTGTTPVVNVITSNIALINPEISGSGSKGNGTGIMIGGNTGAQPHNVNVWDPRIYNCDAGLTFAVEPPGGSDASTGDCTLWAGRFTSCKDGVRSAGFVNHIQGPFISGCNIGIRQTTDRNSGKIVVHSATINNCSDVAIALDRGRGHTIDNLWVEHTSGAGPTEVIRLGSSSYTVVNPYIGKVHLHPLDASELYVLKLIRCKGLVVDHMEVTDDLPTTALVRVDLHADNYNNRIRKISMGDAAPAGWNPSTMTLSDANAASQRSIIIEETPGIAGSQAGATIGHGAVPMSGYDYTVFRVRGQETYFAKRSDGHLASIGIDAAAPVNSGLKDVLTALAADYVSFRFVGDLYRFPQDPAGEEDHWAPNGFVGLVVEGDPGYGTIVANWRDDTIGGYDTVPDVEPFSWTRCNDLTYRNFRIWAGGNQDANNSSDALDFDSCRGTLVERSRARGIVYDGGDSGAISRRGRITNCEIRGTPPPLNAYSGSAASITAQEYRYCVTYVDSIFGETPPSEFTAYKASGTAQIRLAIPIGPAYDATKGVTSRKIYRWSAAQQTYRLLATVADNTTIIYNDSASDASISAATQPPTSGVPLVPKEGIKVLGAQRHRIEGNEVYGVGSHGIQVVRKGTTTETNVNSNGHRIRGNTVRGAGAGVTTSGIAGIYVGGGSHNAISDNNVSNIGTLAGLGLGIYVQGLSGAETAYNRIGPNDIYDDQDVGSPAGAPTTRYGIQINTVGGGTNPDNTYLLPSPIRGMTTAQINDLTGTNTRQYSETTHTHSIPGFAAQVSMYWKAGRYYGARSCMAHAAPTAQALTINQAIASPVYVPADKTVTTIACNVGVAGGAGTSIRMGIYTTNTTDGRPGDLVAGSDSGAISAATAGIKSATINAALSGGSWYWLVAVSDGTPSVTGFTGSQPNLMGSADPSDNSRFSGVRAALGTGWLAGGMNASFPSSPSETATMLTVEVSF